MRKLSYNRAPRRYGHILRVFRTKQEPSRASWAFSFPNHFASWALFSCPLEAHFVVQGPHISGSPLWPAQACLRRSAPADWLFLSIFALATSFFVSCGASSLRRPEPSPPSLNPRQG